MLRKILIHQIKIIYLFLFVTINGCNLYKISKTPLTTEKKINNFIKDHKSTIFKKYIIIHHEEQLYAVENFRMENSYFKGMLIPPNALALNYYEKSLTKKNIEISKKNKIYGNQIHFFVKDLIINDSNDFKFNSSQIIEIRELRHNDGIVFRSVFGTIFAGITVVSIHIIYTISTLLFH